MTIVSEKFVRYRKPIIGVSAALIIYALLGFVAAPWLINRTAVSYVEETFGASLEIQKVSVNPFVLSLGIDGLAFDTPGGDPFIRVGRYFANFQASSLFRWAWTFREHHVDGLELYLGRDSDGQFNVDFLTQTTNEEPEHAAANDTGPIRLLVHDFAIMNTTVHWDDYVPPEPVSTAIGPINIAIAELNTLPERPGTQDVVITTESQGTLSWNGSLQFNPLHSEGRASIRGSHFPLTSAYLKHEVGFDVIDGIADVSLDYRLDTIEDGSLVFAIDNFNLAFSDVLVRTFNEAVGRAGENREVLRLSRIGLTGGSFLWPDRIVSADLLSVDGADLELYRDSDGRLNVLPPTSDDAEPEPAAVARTDAGDPWQLALEQLNLNGLTLQLLDDSVTPGADIGWTSLDVGIRDISNTADAAFPTNLMLTARDGGTISAEGAITILPDPVIDLTIAIEDLAFASAYPYVRSLADVSLDSGALNVAADLRISPDSPFHVAGDFEIVDFLLTETDEGSRLGSWNSLLAENLVFSSSENSLEVSEVRLSAPYGDILIAEDGSINLGRVRKGDESDETETVTQSSDAPGTTDPLAITIGRISIEDAAADFADLSLPLPFSAQIAEMNGELSTISTTSSEPSTVSLEGKVDEFGQVTIGGTLTPMNPPQNTDVEVAFRNVDMPKFSAYSIPFAGREIASGRLDLDLGYTIVDRKLAGANNIVLRDFELGDSVEHAGAMSLPLGLAVALLKDPEGKIDIDLPVEGDLDDPEFRIGGVVLQALGNLVTRIVTSPFALLANLVGAEADELEYLVFDPGRSDLSPPELEKVGKIAEALSLRPELALELVGAYATAEDREAIRTQRFDTKVETRIEALDNDVLYADNRQSVIETLFEEAGLTPDATSALAEIRATHTSPDTENGPGSFDALAFTEDLRRRLIGAETVTDDELAQIAGQRSAVVRDAILAIDPTLSYRALIAAEVAETEVEDETVPMRVRLTTSDDLDIQIPQDMANSAPVSFECGDGREISVRFIGPETIAVVNGESEITLQRERSASGARYSADDIEFWNQGDEAMFNDGTSRLTCTRSVPSN